MIEEKQPDFLGLDDENLLDDTLNTGMVDPLAEIGFNALDDFSQFQENSPATRTVDTNNQETKEVFTSLMDNTPKNVNTDAGLDSPLIEDILKSKGFNPKSIKVHDEDTDETVEVPFSELSREEQIELLNFNNNDPEYSESELEVIDFLRENKMSLKELADRIKEKTLQDLGQTTAPEPVYTVDDFSDDDLFIIDFKNQYGEDFTDDELLAALDKAKENESMYNKQMTKVRANFKEYERQSIEEEHNAKQAEVEAERNEYIKQVATVANSMNDMHDVVEMDRDDKEAVLQFMFEPTVTGQSAFDTALKDPTTRYKAAWYVQHGDQVFAEMRSEYEKEIANLRKQIKTPKASSKPTAVVQNSNNTPYTRNRPKTLEELLT